MDSGTELVGLDVDLDAGMDPGAGCLDKALGAVLGGCSLFPRLDTGFPKHRPEPMVPNQRQLALQRIGFSSFPPKKVSL